MYLSIFALTSTAVRTLVQSSPQCLFRRSSSLLRFDQLSRSHHIATASAKFLKPSSNNCAYSSFFSTSRTFSTANMQFAESPVVIQSDLRLLSYQEDKYDGAIIDTHSLPSNDDEFKEMLSKSMTFWKESKKRGIWLKVPIEKSTFVPIAVQQGFVFHHAEKEYVMMTNWLPETENRLPPNASHQVGVGSIVIHNSKLLLVQERSGPLRGTGVWKMPTGLVEAGEDLAVASEREVLEETGVHAKFTKLLCVRQSHQAPFGKSDLFFVCVLKPLTFDIQMQEVELVGCDWKDPSALMDQPFFKNSPLYSVVHQLIMTEMEAQKDQSLEQQPSMIFKKLPVGFRPGEQSLYYYDPSADK